MLAHAIASFARALPPGPQQPIPGAGCAGSFSALGTSNVGTGNVRDTTVVNLWQVRRAGNALGFVVKTLGGAYWYEDPQGSYYEQITAANVGELHAGGISIRGCFHGDLTP